MTALREIYKCDICGNVTEVVHEGSPALVCCGEPMVKLEEKTLDSKVEKHVPFIMDVEGGVLVKVGQEVDHPMMEKHYIKFIEIQTIDMVCRKELKHTDKPEAFFPIDRKYIIKAREYCNLHGLWSD